MNKFNNSPALYHRCGTAVAGRGSMWRDGKDVGTREDAPEVFLDGVQLTLPQNRVSFAGIRAWLESLALRRGRVLSALWADGEPVGLNGAPASGGSVRRIEAETSGLEAMPLQVLSTALEQTHRLLAQTEAALAQMCINDAGGAREIWWRLAAELKVPLVTLSLLPEPAETPGQASSRQLRRWQLEQLAQLIQELDRSAEAGTVEPLIHALETRLWPWLCRLRESLLLQHETLSAGVRLTSAA